MLIPAFFILIPAGQLGSKGMFKVIQVPMSDKA
jgi:hypothetical protein